jgi:hypothetical protein
MTLLPLLALLALQPAAPQGGMATATAERCPAGPPALPPELSGWARRVPLAAAASPAAAVAAALTPGRGYDVALRSAGEVAFAATPGKPAPAGGGAGLLSLSVDAAGGYAVGLSSAAWIDVIDARGRSVASGAHGRGPPCTGVRKVVDFTLSPGRYFLQLTGSEPSVGVIVLRR